MLRCFECMLVVCPNTSKRHNRLARLLANAFGNAAGPDGNADTDLDVRLRDVPLNNRRPAAPPPHRPAVTVYRADTVDVSPTRPEHVLLVVEVVTPWPDLMTDGQESSTSTSDGRPDAVVVSAVMTPPR
jgi:hypothetical protein